MWEQLTLCRNFIAATETEGELCGRINEENICIYVRIVLQENLCKPLTHGEALLFAASVQCFH